MGHITHILRLNLLLDDSSEEMSVRLLDNVLIY